MSVCLCVCTRKSVITVSFLDLSRNKIYVQKTTLFSALTFQIACHWVENYFVSFMFILFIYSILFLFPTVNVLRILSASLFSYIHTYIQILHSI